MKNKKFKSVWVSPDTHKQIKIEATRQGKKINHFLDDMFNTELNIDCSKTKQNEKKKDKFKFSW